VIVSEKDVIINRSYSKNPGTSPVLGSVVLKEVFKDFKVFESQSVSKSSRKEISEIPVDWLLE
jgi:hypothetical protein